MSKRRRDENEDGESPTPRKSRRSTRGSEIAPSSPVAAEIPSGRKSILRGTPTKLNGLKDFVPSPSPLKKVLFTTPSQTIRGAEKDDEATPITSRNDRSARRKSARTLEVVRDDSDTEGDIAEAQLAAEILDDVEGEAVSDEDIVGVAIPDATQDTPTKIARPRGRPKGKRRERTPTPPPDLPPHELYFYQNRPGATKTSANTLSSQLLLNHETYRQQTELYADPHGKDIEQLKRLHHRGFDQWMFELGEGFNLCMYGYGSKRSLLMGFASHYHTQSDVPPKIIVVNGYIPGLIIRDVLATLAGQVVAKSTKLPTQPPALADLILSQISPSAQGQHITLLVHSLDHPNLRKHQAIFARLAAHPLISLIASVDNPNFALLWDLSLTRSFKFLYHDTTTFAPFTAELDVVEEVNALLGRSGRRLGGKDGVAYVLKSLPENARNLFRILVAEQLALVDGGGEVATDGTNGFGGSDDEDDDLLGAEDEEEALAQTTPSKRVRGRGRPAKKAKAKAAPRGVVTTSSDGVEYRTLYHKAVEEFVCSSELNFRTLLKEFHDHRMIESRKDALGTERLIVPFRREELEGILEELI
ncbi:hypothetical protein B0A48_09455 [Cryoendolithus antarcticus]|uniref:Origin recognition complex subunit 2 n=1 Tax=Cryoendolithus antarcticus TaxID=1507870 RepID=A0A1V8SZF1_9PEZI|nr:hypothetical protein B0A48_09455 [Cryoendolithus antarcticus]